MSRFYAVFLPTADVDWGGNTLGDCELPLVRPNPAATPLDGINKKYIKEVQLLRFEAIRNRLCETNQLRRAAWMTSQAFKGSGAWLGGVGGMLFPPYAIASSEDFIIALRMRMLVSPYGVGLDVHQVIRCQCGSRVNLDSDYLHLLDCKGVRGFSSQRHTRVCQLLEDQLRDVVGSGGSVQKEPMVVPGTKADLLIRRGVTSMLVDIAVCNPGASCYLAAGSAVTPGAAAARRAKDKKAHYSREIRNARDAGMRSSSSSSSSSSAPTATEGTLPGTDVIPLVWEATGRPSAEVDTFMSCYFVNEFAARRKFVYTLAQTLSVKFCVKAVRAWHELLKRNYDDIYSNVSQEPPVEASVGVTSE